MIIVSVLLLVASIVYILWSISLDPLTLSEISMKADNPVSLSLWSINIDTQIIEGNPASVFEVTLLPVYLAVLIAIVLTAFSFKGK